MCRFTHGTVAEYHGLVWNQIGSTVEPVKKYVPVVGKLQVAATKWFRGY